jgi:Fe-S-cluster containining protein
MKQGEVKEICLKCSARCCKFGGVFYTQEEKERVLKAGFKNHFIDYRGFFATKPNQGNCPYLENNLCSIHEVGPTFCRIWSVFPKISNGKREYFLFSCPLSKRVDSEFIKKAIKLADKLPNKIFEVCWESVPKEGDLFEIFKPKELK